MHLQFIFVDEGHRLKNLNSRLVDLVERNCAVLMLMGGFYQADS
jgi:hypothetical protein